MTISKNNVLVVGNGFDLALGLPTSYKDFMKFFLRYRCERNKLPIKQIDDPFYVEYKKLMDDWLAPNQEKNDNLIFNNQFILIMIYKYSVTELFRVKAKDNYKPCIATLKAVQYPTVDNNNLTENYFLNSDITANETNWFNVEEILCQLSSIESYTLISTKIIELYRRYYALDSVCRNIKELFDYGKYDELKQGFNFFKKSLSLYLCAVHNYYKSESVLENFEKLKKQWLTKNYSEIINLNYTHFAEQLFNLPQNSYSHPHGKIDLDNPTKSEIVLGFFTDILIDKYDVSFIEFQKFYQRILYCLGNYETKSTKNTCIDFFGFSCDPADAELLNVLIAENQNYEKINIFCYRDKGNYIVNLAKSIGKDSVLSLTKSKKLAFHCIN